MTDDFRFFDQDVAGNRDVENGTDCRWLNATCADIRWRLGAEEATAHVAHRWSSLSNKVSSRPSSIWAATRLTAPELPPADTLQVMFYRGLF